MTTKIKGIECEPTWRGRFRDILGDIAGSSEGNHKLKPVDMTIDYRNAKGRRPTVPDALAEATSVRSWHEIYARKVREWARPKIARIQLGEFREEAIIVEDDRNFANVYHPDKIHVSVNGIVKTEPRVKIIVGEIAEAKVVGHEHLGKVTVEFVKSRRKNK